MNLNGGTGISPNQEITSSQGSSIEGCADRRTAMEDSVRGLYETDCRRGWSNFRTDPLIVTVWWCPFGLFSRLSRSLIKRLPLRELSDLLVGGTIVETCIEKQPVLRTIIQLDGVVMTFVVPLDSPDESVYKKHWGKVENRLVTIAEQLNGVVRLVTWRFGLLIILISVGHTL